MPQNNILKIFFILLLFTISCYSCKQDGKIKEEAVLDIRLIKDPLVLNPLLSNYSFSRYIHQYLYVPLANYHPTTLELIPILIKEIPVGEKTADGKVLYKLEIREEAVWDDGKPITGYDYLFTIKMGKIPALKSPLHNFISSIESIEIDESNPKKFTVIHDEAYILGKEATIGFPLAPSHIYDDEKLLDQHPLSTFNSNEAISSISTTDSSMVNWIKRITSEEFTIEKVNNAGPYELTQWEPNQFLVLTKKENYWGESLTDNPYLQQGPDKINFYVVPDPTTTVSQLKDGSIDLTSLGAIKYDELKNNAEYGASFDFFTPSIFRYYYLVVNNDSPILQDIDARRAISHLLDIDNIINNLEKGGGTRIPGIVHPSKSSFRDDLQIIDFNPEKAALILKEDGWKDVDQDGDLDKEIDGKMTEFSIDIFVTNAPLGKNVALTLKQNGEKIGVKVNIITKKFAQYRNQNLRTGNYDLAALAMNASPGPDDFYNSWHSASIPPNGRNFARLNSPEIDQIIDKIRATTNPDAADELYRSLQEKVYNEYASLFLYAPVERIIVNSKWSGITTSVRPGYLANTFTLK